MAKSKEQKRLEAKERERKKFAEKHDEAIQHLMGGTNYNRIEREYGKESADLNSRQMWNKFKSWCAEHGLDTHGNIVSGELVRVPTERGVVDTEKIGRGLLSPEIYILK